MRRIALLGLTILPMGLLAGCQFAGSPVAGAGSFFHDTAGLEWHPTTPAAQSENEKRVLGQEVAVAPLLPEPGEVWPGPPAPIPTLADVQKLTGLGELPPPNLGALPGAVFPENAAPPAPAAPKQP